MCNPFSDGQSVFFLPQSCPHFEVLQIGWDKRPPSEARQCTESSLRVVPKMLSCQSVFQGSEISCFVFNYGPHFLAELRSPNFHQIQPKPFEDLQPGCANTLPGKMHTWISSSHSEVALVLHGLKRHDVWERSICSIETLTQCLAEPLRRASLSNLLDSS